MEGISEPKLGLKFETAINGSKIEVDSMSTINGFVTSHIKR